MYHCIHHHPQSLQLQITINCVKVYIYGNTENKIAPGILLQVYVREIQTKMVSTKEEDAK